MAKARVRIRVRQTIGSGKWNISLMNHMTIPIDLAPIDVFWTRGAALRRAHAWSRWLGNIPVKVEE